MRRNPLDTCPPTGTLHPDSPSRRDPGQKFRQRQQILRPERRAAPRPRNERIFLRLAGPRRRQRTHPIAPIHPPHPVRTPTTPPLDQLELPAPQRVERMDNPKSSCYIDRIRCVSRLSPNATMSAASRQLLWKNELCLTCGGVSGRTDHGHFSRWGGGSAGMDRTSNAARVLPQAARPARRHGGGRRPECARDDRGGPVRSPLPRRRPAGRTGRRR